MNVVKDVVKKDLLDTLGGNVSHYSHYGKHYGGNLKKLETTTIWPRLPLPGTFPENQPAWAGTRAYPYLLQPNSQELSCPISPGAQPQMGAETVRYTVQYYQPQVQSHHLQAIGQWTRPGPEMLREISQRDIMYYLSHVGSTKTRQNSKKRERWGGGLGPL